MGTPINLVKTVYVQETPFEVLEQELALTFTNPLNSQNRANQL